MAAPVTSHPDAARAGGPFEAHAAEFAAVTGDDPRLRQVVEADAHEGPVYADREAALYFTSLPLAGEAGPRVAIRRLGLDPERLAGGEPAVLGVSTVARDANVANGMALGADGRLVVCEQGSRSTPAAIARIDPGSGAREMIVDRWRGVPLNSPNDVVVAGDGTIWFTDPSYGFLQGFRPEPGSGDYLYRCDPATGTVTPVADSFDKPNGLAFSPDERTLYVTDSGANHEPGSYDPTRPHHIKALDVVAGRRLVNERLFAVTTPGFPDGLKVDSEGRVYASAASGVQVFDPAGELIGEIHLPGAVNFAFGGPDRNVLFITTDSAVWAAVLNARGATSPQPDRSKGA